MFFFPSHCKEIIKNETDSVLVVCLLAAMLLLHQPSTLHLQLPEHCLTNKSQLMIHLLTS